MACISSSSSSSRNVYSLKHIELFNLRIQMTHEWNGLHNSMKKMSHFYNEMLPIFNLQNTKPTLNLLPVKIKPV